MKVGITGAGGYVGSHLARHLESKGHEVSRLSRARSFLLGETVPAELLKGLDALLHAAYDFKVRGPAEIERVNVKGSRDLFQAAADAGVGRVVFISSMAAFTNCRSLYGLGKLAVEADVVRLGGCAVRAGTIYGGEAGGIFRSMTALVKLPVIPLPGKGDQRLYLVHIDDLSMFVERLLQTDAKGIVRVAFPEPVTLRGILERVAQSLGRRRVFVPIPEGLVMAGLRMAELVLGNKCPLRSDSLLSLLNPDPTPDFSLPESLKAEVKLRPFEIAPR